MVGCVGARSVESLILDGTLVFLNGESDNCAVGVCANTEVFGKLLGLASGLAVGAFVGAFPPAEVAEGCPLFALFALVENSGSV